MFVRHETNYYFELITIGDWKKEAGLDQLLEGNLISDKQVTRYVIRTPSRSTLNVTYWASMTYAKL